MTVFGTCVTLALEAAVWACDPAEVAHIDKELAKNPHNLGIGVVDTKSGVTRLFTYDETDAFSKANLNLQLMAGHEAAAAMASIPLGDARGFVLGKQGNDWHVVNQSHLNGADLQTNRLQMEPQTFNDIVTALQAAGVHNPFVH